MPRRKQPAIPDEVLDQLLGGSDPRAALADGGLLDGLKKALAERALNAELDHHLESGEPDGRANGPNGYGGKTVLTGTGKLELQLPRDRLSTFDPQLIVSIRRRPPTFSRLSLPSDLSDARRSVAKNGGGWRHGGKIASPSA
jgi:putative transposase